MYNICFNVVIYQNFGCKIILGECTDDKGITYENGAEITSTDMQCRIKKCVDGTLKTFSNIELYGKSVVIV